MSKKTSSSLHAEETTAAPASPSVPSGEADAGSAAVADVATGAATGAAAGFGLWGFAMPVANFIGFTASGITGGSAAASMMSATAVAGGGGVAAGSTVAVLQSIGTMGLATPVGLSLVAAGAAIGGTALLIKSKLASDSIGDEAQTQTAASVEGKETVDGEEAFEGEEMGFSTLVEVSADSEKPSILTFEDENKACNAFLVEREETGPWTLLEVSADSGKPNIRTFEDACKARNAFLNSLATSKALFDTENNRLLELGWQE